MPMLKPLFSKVVGSGDSPRRSLRQTFHKMSASGPVAGSLYIGGSQNERDTIPLRVKGDSTQIQVTRRQDLEADYHT